jgi:branched-chain amino acid transport system permease protein
VLLTIWSGLVLGAVYALVALGFAVSMLPSGIFNFAQGAIVVTGIYLTYSVLGTHHLGLAPLLVVNTLVGVALGVVCEVLCVRPLRRGARAAGQQNELITTVGLSIALVGAIGVRWGYLPRAVPFDGPSAPLRVLGIIARPDQLVLLGGAIIAAIGLHLLSRRTRVGQACLAIAEDREAAILRGVNVDALTLMGFAIAGGLGALSAIAIGPITYAIPTLATTLALGGFVAMTLGGQGSFLGNLLGGLIVGVASSLATRYLDANYADLAVLTVLLVTLALRPVGIGGVSAVRDV